MKAWSKVGFAVLAVFLAWLLLELAQFLKEIPPLEDFVRSHGYPLESHEVVTEDGYILTLFRIPHGKRDTSARGPPVLLQHGVVASASHFLLLGPNSSLAFLLADRGYDVWLSNSRGSDYSLKHVSNDISKAEYWDFSWQEMGFYDLPATIDYVLNNTKEEKLSYIGHSMGGTLLAVLLNYKPEYNAKLNIFIGLAPALTFERMNCSIMTFFGYYYSPLLQKLSGEGNWIPMKDFISKLLGRVCYPDGWFFPWCVSFYYNLGESNQARFDEFHSIIAYMFSSGSLKTITHFGQQVYYGKFQAYMHSPEENIKRYGTDVLLQYDVTKITVPTFLFYSENDSAVVSEGVEEVSKRIPNATAFKVKLKTFNHVDFLFGKDVIELVYKQLFRILDEVRSV